MSWPVVKLGDIFKITSGGTPSRRKPEYYDNGNIPWIKTGDLHNKFINDASEFITEEGLNGSSARLYPKGTVLLAMYGATIGACSVLNIKACTNQACAAFTPVKNVDSAFLYYLLKSHKENFVKAGSGGAQPNISATFLKDYEIPLPPLAEQKRIATILDKADAIRRKRQQAIDLGDEFLRSVFLDMFGDPVTNPKGWEVKFLKSVSNIVTGNTPPRKDAENYGDFIEWIKSDNINTPFHFLTQAEEYLSEVGESKGRTVGEGSILMTCIAGSLSCIGNIAIANRKVAFNQQINALVPNESVYLGYLYALMLFSKEQIQNSSTNSMKGMVSKGTLSALSFPIAPLEEQNKFVKIFNNYLEFIDKQSVFISESGNNFNTLSQKAFSGQL